MSDTKLCGLNCDCDTLPSGQRICVLADSPNARKARMADSSGLVDRIYDAVGLPVPSEAHADESLKRVDHTYANDTFTVIARVSHRSSKGEDKAHAVYPIAGVPYAEATAYAEEIGARGVWDDLQYYPPARVLTVRLSREA